MKNQRLIHGYKCALVLVCMILGTTGLASADEPILPAPKPLEPAPPTTQFVADPITDIGLLSAAIGGGGILSLIANTGELTPQKPVDSARLLSIDRAVVKQTNDPHAGMYSNIGLGVAGVYAAAAPLLTGFEDGAEAGLVDAFIYGESVSFAWASSNLAKLAVRRPRPTAYQEQEELNRIYGPNAPSSTDTNSAESFFSGHSAMTSAISATATYMAFTRSPGTARPWITLVAGTLLTTFVDIERVRSGSHFPTDVLAATTVGAGIGLLVPHFHRADRLKQRPVWVGANTDGARFGVLTLSGLF